MPVIVLISQVLVPLLVLVWLLVSPAAGILAYIVQVLSIALILLGLALVALWSMPPFWLPWLYGGMLVAIVLIISTN
ncbi:MAG: hypothetical protein WD709_03005 [Gammaproteobacteria bacterium]